MNSMASVFESMLDTDLERPLRARRLPYQQGNYRVSFTLGSQRNTNPDTRFVFSVLIGVLGGGLHARVPAAPVAERRPDHSSFHGSCLVRSSVVGIPVIGARPPSPASI